MIHKKFLGVISLFLILLITVMSSCTVNQSDSDITTDVPQKTPMFVESFRPLTTGSIPTPAGSIEPNVNAYDSLIYYGRYDSSLPQSALTTYRTFEAFSSEVVKELRSNDESYHVNSSDSDTGAAFNANMLDMFDEEYFDEHFVLALRLTLPGGSVKAALSNIVSDGDSTKIYLTSVAYGDVGICDMVSVNVIIGLSVEKYDINNKTVVLMNGMPIKFASGTGETM